MNILESSRTGNYKLVEPISQDAGSMLYLAEDNEQQTVFLEIYGATKPETAVSRLRTIQNIPAFSLIDVGLTPDETPFAIMPFSPGTLLSDLLRENPAAFTPNEAIALVQQLTTTIEHAQNEDVSHAGLRPEKIWITESRQLIILGWGESAPTEITAADPSQIDYIAPEYRAEGIPTAQTNIYALGVLLYTLLANHPPHISSTAEWDIFSNANESQMEPLEKARPGLPPAFYQLVRNCLWSQPWNRYDSLPDFGAALDTIPGATKKTVGSSPAAPRRTNGRFLTPPLLYAAIGIIAVALLGSLFFIFRGSGGTETDAAEATQPPLPVLIDAVETTTQTAVPTETTAPTNTAVLTATATDALVPTETATTATVTTVPTETVTAVLTPTQTATTTCVPIPPPGWVLYSIQANDSLFNLAITTGTTVERVQAVNCLADVNLSIGQSIYLPALPATETPVPPTPEPTSSSDGGSGGSSGGSSPNPPKRPTPSPPPPP